MGPKNVIARFFWTRVCEDLQIVRSFAQLYSLVDLQPTDSPIPLNGGKYLRLQRIPFKSTGICACLDIHYIHFQWGFTTCIHAETGVPEKCVTLHGLHQF